MSSVAPIDRFFHHYPRTLDAKNRVTIPSRWRDGDLEEMFALADGKQKILKLLPREELERVGREVLARPGLDAGRARDFRRQLFSRAVLCPVDKQGRLLLPATMLESLELAGEVMLVGVGERVEVWHPQRWHDQSAEQTELFESISEEIGF